ncbi:hypothetical protein [Streptomyces cavernae]|uniref:hypothetical protein n=1 Tax=Streptomyces cavernae TaxID=2259034 RepID=UPI000FEBD567|nr:hypothetical protein [Streptomyces cavernae]
MNGIDLALRTLHQGERNLAEELLDVSERHRSEHEIHHVATDLAGWSREHVRRLADTAADHGVHLGAPPDATSEGGFAPPTPRRQAAEDSVEPAGVVAEEPAGETAGHRPPPGLLLLRDLRELHLMATENSLHWEMLAQLAQARKDGRLLSLSAACHPQTLRQMRWTNTMIKTLSPQVLTSL